MAENKQTDTAAKAEVKKIKVYVVKSLAEGFRRIGLAFTREAQHLDASVLTEAQKAALTSDPNLSVTTATVTVAAGGTTANPVVTPAPAAPAADDSTGK
jgi:hypothetical protein